ncbi:tyrosine-type recombinase/integrase [Flavihumibacter profundi]|uniref:tyrosine-type recombinase/integrase n=1 Tax=Flavihumibacter profundi TaxID=2716883 RepID=UPI001CC6B489|nr:site-specific integrase [Flavihumibacter profundi]MBZ5859452.1 site-specific integrase [Flavihumibacter profundi]
MSKVKVRMKPITGGRQAIYLDYYPPIPNPVTGKPTRREFLKLFLFDETEYSAETYIDSNGKEQRRFAPVLDSKGKPKRARLNEAEKKHNHDMEILAESIRAQRQLLVSKGNYGFLSEEKQKVGIVDYFEQLAKKRIGGNSGNWQSALLYLKEFTNGGDVPFKDINERFGEEFKEFLLTAPSRKSKKTTLSQNSALSYFNKFKAVLKQAYKDGYLERDVNSTIKRIKEEETERQYLTLEELKLLASTQCSVPVLKNAVIFSSLTGLRFSDIKKLIWSEVQHSSTEGYFIRFRQKKTKLTETLPISDEAFDLLGERGNEKDHVFDDLKYSYTQTELPKWLKRAGINKGITFHGFRHTNATLLLSFGVDLYVISEMLGHREIKTTQIYAKIVNERKREAANKIKIKF